MTIYYMDNVCILDMVIRMTVSFRIQKLRVLRIPSIVFDRIWHHIQDKDHAKFIIGPDFLLNYIILKKEKDVSLCKYRLRVVESSDSIELMVTENEEGDFQEILNASLKRFLERGIRILREETSKRYGKI